MNTRAIIEDESARDFILRHADAGHYRTIAWGRAWPSKRHTLSGQRWWWFVGKASNFEVRVQVTEPDSGATSWPLWITLEKTNGAAVGERASSRLSVVTDSQAAAFRLAKKLAQTYYSQHKSDPEFT